MVFAMMQALIEEATRAGFAVLVAGVIAMLGFQWRISHDVSTIKTRLFDPDTGLAATRKYVHRLNNRLTAHEGAIHHLEDKTGIERSDFNGLNVS